MFDKDFGIARSPRTARSALFERLGAHGARPKWTRCSHLSPWPRPARARRPETPSAPSFDSKLFRYMFNDTLSAPGLWDERGGLACAPAPAEVRLPGVVAEAYIPAQSGVLTDADKEVVSHTWRLIEPIQETAADLFYRRLFELRPEYQPLFKTGLDAQKRKLMAMLAFVVKSLSWPESAWRQEVDQENDLFLIVLALGRRHRELYHVPDEAYDTVREVLVWTLDYGLGEAFSDEARAAWKRVYDLVATTMLLGRRATDMGRPMEPGSWGQP